MLLEFDIQKLKKAIDSFYSSMGVSISILYEDYSVIGSRKLNNPYCHFIQGSKSGLAKCMDSNYLLLDERTEAAYPDAVEDGEGNIYVAYDYNRTTDKELYLAVITEEDILAGKILGENSKLKILVNKATGVKPE